MRSFLILLTVILSGFCQVSHHMDTRSLGVVSEVKLLYMDDQKTVFIWVKADQEYLVKGKNEIPYIYVGDTLFEYWADYKKMGVGTRRSLTIYEIADQDPWRHY